MDAIKDTLTGTKELFRILKKEPGILLLSLFITTLCFLFGAFVYYATQTVIGIVFYFFNNPITFFMCLISLPFLIQKYRQKHV